ncbi:MotA/TolQ/ExbB proton channel family protein [Sphingomonas jatrophae]|uniref:Biopolymer transport protein ExbB n=1 Tax=Sphingomonas jatrophae TaxID=1166337 RepID=A0A1I6M5W3_9SPHN|nr:MotA/TolQ/ExbB proton channel family protein [Sphingomonas jatrophae]SFS11100.1 outer membrane transport energization protein ExbB [Sphingomonas jatrophae]
MATPAGAPPADNPYGLMAALEQGGTIAWTIFIILVIMSAASWYIIFTKLFEQQKILNQAKRTRTSFWGNPSLRDGMNKLEKNSAYRQIVDDGLRAEEEHKLLTDPVDQHEWLLGSLGRSQAAVNSKLGNGLAVLATVGSTSPFVGLLGTVIGIYRALVKIGASGQASIDAVAGPVGEALIMTAIGLVVAVPAVLGYNWLIRRNKVIAEQLSAFSTDLHGYMVSGGKVKPQIAAARTAPTPPLKTGSAAVNPKA